MRRAASALRRFLDSEASGGQVLMGVAVLALGVANSPLAGAYFAALHREAGGLSLLYIRSKNGPLVPLSSLATLTSSV